ncbi:bis(5'-nucleosyl)-tetraphosphatase (symmetrical) YqeK [Gloeobacter morelensis]|uniref:bis(5'-nucleosyl)-tetraphosphatase (symmetrical) n=1 Tax=Gloeobacter morelensis MG652769 TaxID=2781736 RepID=A0ABY3PNT1_9CYAN|nr:bis(5'-nucleosyl)-tetraphosphatase (symmetrical) YqeK [Gloeobacter morelensis]UFP95363.1 bis(5'-nucleosyl)-tetraphosphatase (symmetrical) YqeK [Gloeobacter morelensis MG652769]
MQTPALEVSWRVSVLEWLAQHVPPRRIEHILGVEATAVELAKRYGASPERAGRAGLLHDLAKYFPPEKLLLEADRLGIAVDAIQRRTPHLLHADVSAGLAREIFGEADPQVLAAIANHTLGDAEMDLLSQILYVADWIEPTRKGEDVARVRQAAQADLMEAVLLGAEQTILELIESRRAVHPRTLLTRNWALSTLQEYSSR